MAIELVKVVKNAPIEHYKNAFLNLALPLFVFSEPASAVKTRMRLYARKCSDEGICWENNFPKCLA